MSQIAITRRYWFWQYRQMMRDRVAYIVSMRTLRDVFRPRAVKYIPLRDNADNIPTGWRVIPGDHIAFRQEPPRRSGKPRGPGPSTRKRLRRSDKS